MDAGYEAGFNHILVVQPNHLIITGIQIIFKLGQFAALWVLTSLHS